MPLQCGCELSATRSTHQQATALKLAAAEVITRAFVQPGALDRPAGVAPELVKALADLRKVYELSHGRRPGSAGNTGRGR